jgi:hypothetical protein
MSNLEKAARQAKPASLRPKQHDYASYVGYTRALEAYCDSLEQAEPVVLAHNDILRMAREAGWPASVVHPHGPGVDTSGYSALAALERFAALVRADVVASAKKAEPVVDDLVTLVLRMARNLKRAGHPAMADRAVDFLRRKGLQPSPLRDDSAALEQAEPVTVCCCGDPTIYCDQCPKQAEPVVAQAEPVALTDAAIEAAITTWFGWRMSDDSDHAPFRDRMRAAIKAAQDFKEAT